MTSNDLIIAAIGDLRVEINARLGVIEQRLDVMQSQIHDNARDISHLQHSLYWGFAIMALVVAFVGFMMTLGPVFLEIFRERKLERKSDEKIQAMIDASIQKALKNN